MKENRRDIEKYTKDFHKYDQYRKSYNKAKFTLAEIEKIPRERLDDETSMFRPTDLGQHVAMLHADQMIGFKTEEEVNNQIRKEYYRYRKKEDL